MPHPQADKLSIYFGDESLVIHGWADVMAVAFGRRQFDGFGCEILVGNHAQ